MNKPKRYDWKKDPYRSIVPPLYLGSVYGFLSADEGAAIFSGAQEGYAYTRLGNPTIAAFESWLADAEGGARTFATGSGLSALLLAVVALTKKRKRIVTSPYIYGGSYHLMHLLRQRDVKIDFVKNARKLKSWEEAVTKETAFVLLETPSNPSVDVFDIAAIAEIAHKKGAMLIVDNTIATPALQKPLAFGADAVLHSVTKYLMRQSGGLGGALVGSKKFMELFGDELFDWFVHTGLIMHPFSAWLALQQSYTLENDMRTFSAYALRVAETIERNPKVKKIYYPYLATSPHYALAKRQMPNGGSGLFAFEVGSFTAAKKLVNSLRSVAIAPHLGDIRSLIIHPASTTHSRLSSQERKAVGISDTLIRCSVGLANIHETIRDLEQALRKI